MEDTAEPRSSWDDINVGGSGFCCREVLFISLLVVTEVLFVIVLLLFVDRDSFLVDFFTFLMGLDAKNRYTNV